MANVTKPVASDKAFFVRFGSAEIGRKLEDGTEKILTKIGQSEYPTATYLDICVIQDILRKHINALFADLVDLGYTNVITNDPSLAQQVEALKAQIRN